MNELSSATDRGFAFHLADQLNDMNMGVSKELREQKLLDKFQHVFQLTDFPDTPACPFHAIADGVDWKFIFVLGCRTVAQANAFYSAAFERHTASNAYCNRYAFDASEVVRSHAEDIRPVGTVQINAGHSVGGCIMTTFALNDLTVIAPNKVGTCVTFGSPRCWQRWNQTPNSKGWDIGRWMASRDPLLFFPPHADEAITATALMTAERADFARRADHFGRGRVLTDTGPEQDRMLAPEIAEGLSDGVLWYWFFGHETQSVAHSIANYKRLTGLPGYLPPTNYTYQPEVRLQVLPPPIEAPGRLMQAVERREVIRQAEIDTQTRRGPEPTRPPYRAVKRGGVWSCECDGQVITTGSGKKTAQAMARRMNAAWRQWWRTRIASTGALSVSVNQNFPQ